LNQHKQSMNAVGPKRFNDPLIHMF